uniref:Uncharacterized protein n=1 Tax=Oncorhynchus tshawytscha TaxID=74940 RepID=A0A8C8IW14_ONCTS
MDSAIEKHCSELVARERSGHTALTERNVLYVWGGYVSIADDEVFLPNDEIWLYDLERGVWEMCRMSGEVPPPMSGTCGCSLNGDMYIFGGCDDNGQTNQLYCVNLLDGKYTWRKINHKSGSPPSPRDKLSCWVFNGRQAFFKKQNNVDDIYWGWNNEVHMFDPTSASWSEPHTSVRRYIERVYLFLKRHDIIYNKLKNVVPASNVPMGRSWHTLTAISDSGLFLFGGLSIDCKPMSDGWVFDVGTKKWREFEHPYMNKPRLWHTACQGKDSDVIVFGGSCNYILRVDTGHCNDALVFQTQPYPLFRENLFSARRH